MKISWKKIFFGCFIISVLVGSWSLKKSKKNKNKKKRK